MTISEVKTVISQQPESLPTYIRIQDGSDTEVHSIIVSADHQMSDNCLSYGAYYGYVGGGVFDGGYFKVDIENSILQNFSYDDISELSEDEVEILEALMGRLWSLIDDEDDVPTLTNIGHQFCEKNGGLDDGVLIANDFDGTDLEGIEWELSLYFEG